MRNLLIIIILSMSSCSVGDVSKDLGNNYRIVEEKPRCIIYQSEFGRAGEGVIVVPPDVVDYRYGERFIMAKVDKRMGGEIEWWIVDKNTQEVKSFSNREDFWKYLRDNEIPILL